MGLNDTTALTPKGVDLSQGRIVTPRMPDISPIPGQRCGNCLYLLSAQPVPGNALKQGDCHGGPGTAVVVQYAEVPQAAQARVLGNMRVANGPKMMAMAAYQTMFPKMLENGWCGKWKEKTNVERTGSEQAPSGEASAG